jgi:two-component system, OmpR family, phosphate regulon response regulator PhoB
MTARVLILDEDPALCDQYRTLLEDHGYTATTATTLPEIDTVIRLQPDLILMDHFYGSTPPGWIFLIQLRTFTETEQIPVVLCTANRAAVAAEARDLATFNVNVVYTPFDPSDLLATIRYSLPSERLEVITPRAKARNDKMSSYTLRPSWR